MHVNVVFASDKNYVEQTAVAICSLFENNRDLTFDVYVMNVDIDKVSWVRLEAVAKRYGQNLIDLKLSDHELKGLIVTYHFTIATYYRLLIPEKLALDKVLYLDADIVVNGSIKDLYNTELGDSYLAAVITPGFDRHKELEMAEDARYFNAGVMVINLAKWRDDGLKEKVIDIVKRKPEAMVYSDQCGINSIVNGRWKEVHPKYNVLTAFFEKGSGALSASFPDGQLVDAVNHPVIIHWAGAEKPWKFHRGHPYRSLYWKYLRKTPFNHLFSEDFTVAHIMRWCIARVARRGSLGN